MTTALFEIFEEVEKATSKAEKIAVLHRHSGKDLKAFLSYIFNPDVKWLIPEGHPPYEPSKDDVNYLRARVWQDFRLIQHFTNLGPYPDMKPAKRQSMFIDLIQTLHPKDAELIIYVKDNRAVPQKSVNRGLIEEAFPILTKTWAPRMVIVEKEKPTVTENLTSFLTDADEEFLGGDEEVKEQPKTEGTVAKKPSRGRGRAKK